MLPREHLLVLEVLLVLLPRLLCIRRSCCEADRKRCGECNGNPMRLHERDATRSKRSVIESRDTSGVPSIDSFSFETAPNGDPRFSQSVSRSRFSSTTAHCTFDSAIVSASLRESPSRQARANVSCAVRNTLTT